MPRWNHYVSINVRTALVVGLCSLIFFVEEQQDAPADLEQQEQAAAGQQQLEAAAAVEKVPRDSSDDEKRELIHSIDMELHGMRDAIKSIKGEIDMELEELKQKTKEVRGQVQAQLKKQQQQSITSSVEDEDSGEQRYKFGVKSPA